MINDDIKSKKEESFLQIKIAEEGLKQLRTICKHEKTIETNYSYRIGSYQLAEICEYCGEFIKYK